MYKNFKKIINKIERDYFFDKVFYKKTYADEMDHNEEPIKHFLLVGMNKGFLPNHYFDPLVYKIHHPSVAKSGKNPLVHYIENGKKNNIKELPELSILLPEYKFDYQHNNCQLPENTSLKELFKKSRDSSTKHSKESSLTFSIKRSKYTLYSPQITFFLNRIIQNRPFALIRRPHGLWDSLVALEQVKKELSKEKRILFLNKDEIFTLATRICHATSKDSGKQVVYEENFLREVIHDMLSEKFEAPFFYSISFHWFPSYKNTLFPFPDSELSKDFCKRRLKEFNKYFSDTDILYDASIWKKGVISGSLQNLPKICRDHPVVLVGPEWFSSLGKRWNLKSFYHLKIPHDNSMELRNLILEECLDLIRTELQNYVHSEHNRPAPIFLFQASASLSAWFIKRLYQIYPQFFFIDMGQALNAWFLDEPFTDNYMWRNIYFMEMIKNLNLESYYMKYKKDEYISWIQENI